MVIYMKIRTLEDVLVMLGSEEPFDFSKMEDTFSDCLTESGNIAYEKLGCILEFMQEENIIKGFNNDKLDKFVNFNY